MKHLFILSLLFILGCGFQNKGINVMNLNMNQVRNGGPGKGAPGKCYAKMKHADGTLDWYEVICGSQKQYFERASECLIKLGYPLIDNNFNTSNGNALVDFQKENGLVYGSLDEATLYRLIQKTKSIE